MLQPRTTACAVPLELKRQLPTHPSWWARATAPLELRKRSKQSARTVKFYALQTIGFLPLPLLPHPSNIPSLLDLKSDMLSEPIHYQVWKARRIMMPWSYHSKRVTHVHTSVSVILALWYLHCDTYTVILTLWYLHCDTYTVILALWYLHCDKL